MSADDELPGEMPVCPATGLNPEVRQFMSRLMAGYEAMHRSQQSMIDMLATRLEKSESAAAKFLELQLRLAEEREELVSKRHRRELETEAARASQENSAALMKDLRSMALLVGKKFVGVPLSGNDSHGLQDLLSTMSLEQVEKVMSTGVLELSMGQRQLLASTLSSLAQAEESKPEAAE